MTANRERVRVVLNDDGFNGIFPSVAHCQAVGGAAAAAAVAAAAAHSLFRVLSS